MASFPSATCVIYDQIFRYPFTSRQGDSNSSDAAIEFGFFQRLQLAYMLDWRHERKHVGALGLPATGLYACNVYHASGQASKQRFSGIKPQNSRGASRDVSVANGFS
jgi:hypothetical protein